MNDGIINARFVADATDGEIIYDSGFTAAGFSVDSRNIEKNAIFVAIKGENTDGHLYMLKAAMNGAGGIICENPPEYDEISKYPCFVVKVKDSVIAMGKVAEAYKREMNAVTVGVTGSVGKTTTRSLIQSVLCEAFETHATSGNFNNEIGLPVSVLGMKTTTEAAVFELGMGKKGDIDYLSNIVKPDIGVITNIGTAHIEYLGSRENIRDAKLEIRNGMKKDGVLILNGDEPLLCGIDGAVYCAINNKNADYFAENITFSDGGMTFDVVSKAEKIKSVFVPAFGEHIVLDCLYAWAVGKILKIDVEKIKEGIASYQSVGMRQRIVEKNGVTFILDYYNASAESIYASEKVGRELSTKNGGRFIAVIGSVLELGANSERIHREIGAFSSKTSDIYVTFGEDADYSADEARKSGMTNVYSFTDIESTDGIINCVLENIKKGDTVLFKASHGIRLGRVADAVLERI